MSRSYPDRRRLETQCMSALAFVKSENDIIDCPIWVLIINVVAMDMLKSKLPPGESAWIYFATKFYCAKYLMHIAKWISISNLLTAIDLWICILVHRPFDIRNRPRIPVPDEDPYAIAATDLESSGSSGFGNGIYGHIAREQMLMQSHYPQLRRDKPPKLPPRDNMYGHHEMPSVMKVNILTHINRQPCDTNIDLNAEWMK